MAKRIRLLLLLPDMGILLICCFRLFIGLQNVPGKNQHAAKGLLFSLFEGGIYPLLDRDLAPGEDVPRHRLHPLPARNNKAAQSDKGVSWAAESTQDRSPVILYNAMQPGHCLTQCRVRTVWSVPALRTVRLFVLGCHQTTTRCPVCQAFAGHSGASEDPFHCLSPPFFSAPAELQSRPGAPGAARAPAR